MRLITISLSVLLLFCCQEDQQENVISISGRLISNGEPVSGAEVTIDGIANFHTTSDNNGQYAIPGVSAGAHIIEVVKYFEVDDVETSIGPVSKKVFSITADHSVVVDDINIAAPITVKAEDEGISSATIRWRQLKDADFQAYRVYVSSASDMSQDNTNLIYVTTHIDDTTLTLTNLYEKTQYFYKVVATAGNGSVSESNVVMSETKARALMPNSSFEDLFSDGYPRAWQIYFTEGKSSISIDNTNSVTGSNSLLFEQNSSGACYEMTIINPINPAVLRVGKNYRVAFKYKADFDYLNEVTLTLDYDHYIYKKPIAFNNSDNWQEVYFDFTMPSQYSFDFEVGLRFCIPVAGRWWIDDVTLEAI